jgi:hypothetical protein
MPVSESLAGGATISKDSQERATPAPRSVATPAPAKPASRAPLAAGLGVVVLVLGAVVAWQATRGPVTPTVLTSPTPDAAVNAPPNAAVVAAAEDAGPADAGVTVVAAETPKPARDAGTAKPARGDAPGVPTAAEQAMLDELQKLYDAQDYGSMLLRRGAVQKPSLSPAARLRGLKLLIRAACKRHEDRYLVPFIEELKPHASAATLATLRRECIADWPDAEPKWD